MREQHTGPECARMTAQSNPGSHALKGVVDHRVFTLGTTMSTEETPDLLRRAADTWVGDTASDDYTRRELRNRANCLERPPCPPSRVNTRPSWWSEGSVMWREATSVMRDMHEHRGRRGPRRPRHIHPDLRWVNIPSLVRGASCLWCWTVLLGAVTHPRSKGRSHRRQSTGDRCREDVSARSS